jgi:hypothetical protein
MKCSEIKDLLSQYIDGMLDPDLRAETEAHLKSCDECRALYDDLLSVTSALGGLKPLAMPQGLDERILRSVFSPQETIVPISARPKKKLYRRLASVAAIFTVGIFVFAMYNDSQQIFDEVDVYRYSAGNAVEESARKEDTVKDDIDDFVESNSQQSTAVSENDTQAQSEEVSDKATGGTSAPAPASDSVTLFNSTKPTITGEKPCRGENAPVRCTGEAVSQMRDSGELGVYMHCLEEELKGVDFEILSCENLDDGRWRFAVVCNSETLYYLGQDGTIWIEEAEQSSL